MISLYGIIFFVMPYLTQMFTSITFVTGPQYYDFPITDEVKNSNIILIFLYLILFLVLSVKWKRDKNIEARAENHIELRPLKNLQ